MPPRRGYEALIGMFNWVMPLDMERTLRVLFDTFYTRVSKNCVPGVQTPEYVEFRTRHASLLSSDSKLAANFSEHYPFDQVLLRPLSIEDSTKSEGSSKDKEQEAEDSSIPASKQGLLRSLVMQSSKKSMSHIFKATFTSDTMVNLVQIYFSDQ